MIVIDVLDFMAEDDRQLVFGLHLVEHSFANVNRPAGQRKCVDHVVIGNQVKTIRRDAGVRAAATVPPTRLTYFSSASSSGVSLVTCPEYCAASCRPISISCSSESRVKCMGMRVMSRWASAIISTTAFAETGVVFARRWLQYRPASETPRMTKKIMSTTGPLHKYCRMFSRKRM